MSEAKDERAVIWKGWLKAGPTKGTIVGELRDQWDWAIEITGTLQDDRSYKLEGKVGRVPDALRIGAIDDPPAKAG